MEYGLGISLPVSVEQVLWVSMGFALILYAVVSLIFHHHWNYYGIGRLERYSVIAMFHLFALTILSVAALSVVALGSF